MDEEEDGLLLLELELGLALEDGAALELLGFCELLDGLLFVGSLVQLTAKRAIIKQVIFCNTFFINEISFNYYE